MRLFWAAIVSFNSANSALRRCSLSVSCACLRGCLVTRFFRRTRTSLGFGNAGYLRGLELAHNRNFGVQLFSLSAR